jgi:hypothetical protein
MTDVMRVDPAGLHWIWPTFAALSCRLDDLAAGLSATLDVEEGCWGGDEMGTAFARSYVAAAQQARHGLDSVVATVSDISAALLAVATNVDACEQRVHHRCGPGVA